MTVDCIKHVKNIKTISRENKAANIQEFRSALFGANWTKNALLTIVTLGYHYRTTLKNEATKYYKEARRLQKVEHFPALQDKIIALKNAPRPEKVKTPHAAHNYLLAALKKEDVAKNYSDKALVGAILAVSASRKVFDPQSPPKEWSTIRDKIIDLSNGREGAIYYPIRYKLNTLPLLLQKIEMLKNNRVQPNSLIIELKKIAAFSTCYTEEELQYVLKNPEKFAPSRLQRIPNHEQEKAWHDLMGSSPSKAIGITAYFPLIKNFAFDSEVLEQVHNRDLNNPGPRLALDHISSPEMLAVYQAEFPHKLVDLLRLTAVAALEELKTADLDAVYKGADEAVYYQLSVDDIGKMDPKNPCQGLIRVVEGSNFDGLVVTESFLTELFRNSFSMTVQGAERSVTIDNDPKRLLRTLLYKKDTWGRSMMMTVQRCFSQGLVNYFPRQFGHVGLRATPRTHHYKFHIDEQKSSIRQTITLIDMQFSVFAMASVGKVLAALDAGIELDFQKQGEDLRLADAKLAEWNILPA